jgi:hypothetical protein
MSDARARAVLATLALLLAGSAAAADSGGQAGNGQGELLLFGSADARALDGDDPRYDSTGLDLTADVLGSWGLGPFRVLGELLLSTEEQELERLQFGWEMAPETYLWLGRFHQPASAWNMRHHHGQYLQPSITRPAIEDWEDDGGVLPQHLVGALGEARLQLGRKSGLSLAAGAGIGPLMTPKGLKPFEIFDPRGVERRPTFSLQAAFLPDVTGDDGVGLLAMHSEIGLEQSTYTGPAGHVDLGVVGLGIVWTWGPWQLESTLYAVRTDFIGDVGGSDRFLAGYAQLRRELGNGLSILGRFEGSADTSGSRYLALFPDFVEQRTVIDLRWDFARQQALSVELADGHARYGNFREFRLQWSSVFP